MSAELGQIWRANERLEPPRAAGIGWRLALPLASLAILAILLIYWQTAESIVAIWYRSETFAHGFLIAPISLALVWSKRREVAKLAPAPDFLGLWLLAGLGLGWLVAGAGQVQVVQQYAMTAMIPAAVVAITGRRVARALAFPLGFLLLGVPVGEVLIPPLMHWTAHFTVTGLKLSGMPVYQEGTFFTTPWGNWSIVEGCSGLRYLIAAVTVGILYAYLSYTRLWKRALFVVVSVIVPIIANGLRAYTIVMIGTFIDMRLAMGIDHLIYGWLFFGFIIFLLFWIGSYWRDPLPAATDPGNGRAAPAAGVSRTRMLGAMLAVVALAAAWPLYAARLERKIAGGGAPALAAPADESGWQREPGPITVWRPRYSGASASVFDVYRKGTQPLVLYVGYYRHQHRGAELVTTTNVMVVQKDPVWEKIAESRPRVNLGGGPVTIRQTELKSAGQRLLVWDWFRIAGHDLSSPYLAKLLLARERLLEGRDDGAAIILAVPYVDGQLGRAERTLHDFVRDMLPSVNATVRHAAAGAAVSAEGSR